MEWQVFVNNVRVDNQYEDTYMEAELAAKIKYGLTAHIVISEVQDAQEDQSTDH